MFCRLVCRSLIRLPVEKSGSSDGGIVLIGGIDEDCHTVEAVVLWGSCDSVIEEPSPESSIF